MITMVFTGAVPRSSCCTTAVARGIADHTEPHYRLSGPIRARDRGRPPRAHPGIRKPYDALVDYLDELDEYGGRPIDADRRARAAWLRLSAERAARAHPYNTTPEHTPRPAKASARKHCCCPSTRCADHRHRRGPCDRPQGNRRHVQRLRPCELVSTGAAGFTDADLTRPGSDQLIDALVAYGTPDDIAKGLDEHLRAGLTMS